MIAMRLCNAYYLLKKGSNRWVFLIGRFAFKIPSLYSYKNFLWGLLANMQEKEFNSIDELKDRLCPVIFYIPFGLLVVMPRARVLKIDEISKEELEKFCTLEEKYIPAELKHDSFGYFKGKLVAIDYG